MRRVLVCPRVCPRGVQSGRSRPSQLAENTHQHDIRSVPLGVPSLNAHQLRLVGVLPFRDGTPTGFALPRLADRSAPQRRARLGGGVFSHPRGIALKRAWSDGTTALELSRLELVERLMALVPPPRANQVHYHGVLASRSRLRARVRPTPPKAKKRPTTVGKRLSKRPQGRSRWRAWSSLLWRVFGVVGFGCPTCGHAMQLRTVVMPPATLRVLASLPRSARDPP
jgi:hypothetical protein